MIAINRFLSYKAVPYAYGSAEPHYRLICDHMADNTRNENEREDMGSERPRQENEISQEENSTDNDTGGESDTQ